MAGWALGQAGLKTATRKGLAALILGANLPDVDVFFGWVSWEPLAIHRGFTHGLVGGVLAMPPLLAGLLWLLDRWQVRRGAHFKSGLSMHFGWLLALAYIGTISHPLLDLLTTYSVQLLSPFSSRWFHADALFIIDIWIWLLLAAAIGMSRRKEKRGEGDWQRPARIAVAVTFAYVGLNLAITSRANAAVTAANGKVEALFASPPPILFWQRRLLWRDGDCYRRAEYAPLAGYNPLPGCETDNMDHAMAREAIRRDPVQRKFLKWSILPQATVQRGRCSLRVRIGDARYGEAGRSRLVRETAIPTGAAGC